jgi:hypothetical protein
VDREWQGRLVGAAAMRPRQDGCTCGSAPMDVAHLPGCPVVPMRTREEVEAAIRERVEDHMRAVARWAADAERAQHETCVATLEVRVRVLEGALQAIEGGAFNELDECRWCTSEVGDLHDEGCPATTAERALRGEH